MYRVNHLLPRLLHRSLFVFFPLHSSYIGCLFLYVCISVLCVCHHVICIYGCVCVYAMHVCMFPIRIYGCLCSLCMQCLFCMYAIMLSAYLKMGKDLIYPNYTCIYVCECNMGMCVASTIDSKEEIYRFFCRHMKISQKVKDRFSLGTRLTCI